MIYKNIKADKDLDKHEKWKQTDSCLISILWQDKRSQLARKYQKKTNKGFNQHI